jgi:hypothetical protein
MGVSDEAKNVWHDPWLNIKKSIITASNQLYIVRFCKLGACFTCNKKKTKWIEK